MVVEIDQALVLDMLLLLVDFKCVEHELTAQELLLEWSAVMEKEYERLKEAHNKVSALQQEVQEVEEKWAAKL